MVDVVEGGWDSSSENTLESRDIALVPFLQRFSFS